MSVEVTQKELKIFMANPKGFCAGVDRAIEIVARALELHGAPVYVRHEIVHNELVVTTLKDRGAVFVDELSEIPDNHRTTRPVVFSAHGVPKSVPNEAKVKNMIAIDATCPLVSKVHRGVERHYDKGAHIILIGHRGHVEVVGTMGQLPDGAVTLVETIDDVMALDFSDDQILAYCTQTTLSVDDTKDVVKALKKRYPNVIEPHGDDICYATTNRQDAVKDIAQLSDLVLVVGSNTSSNSKRLVDTAQRSGCSKAYLIDDYRDIQLSWFEGVQSVGISAGASAPQVCVDGVVTYLREQFVVDVETINTRAEDIEMKVPRELKNVPAVRLFG